MWKFENNDFKYVPYDEPEERKPGTRKRTKRLTEKRVLESKE